MVKEKAIFCQPLLDLNEEESITAASLSIFMDAAALEQMITIAMIKEPSGAVRLLQTCIVRGMFNIVKVLRAEFLEFLQHYDLLEKFFNFLFEL